MPWCAGAPERRRDPLGHVTGQRRAVDRRGEGARASRRRRRRSPRRVAARESSSTPSAPREPSIAAVNSATFSSPIPARDVAVVLLRRDEADAADRGEAASGQQRGAGQRPGAAAGPAERDELVEAEVVEDRRHVGGVVGDRGGGRAVRARGGRAVPGAGVGDRAAARARRPPRSSIARRARHPGGVPWWDTRGKPSSGPETSTSRKRPSGVGTSRSWGPRWSRRRGPR